MRKVKNLLRRKSVKSRTKNEIYKDFIRSVNRRYIYKGRYSNKDKMFLLNELYKKYRNETLKTTSLLDLEKQYSIKNYSI